MYSGRVGGGKFGDFSYDHGLKRSKRSRVCRGCVIGFGMKLQGWAHLE